MVGSSVLVSLWSHFMHPHSEIRVAQGLDHASATECLARIEREHRFLQRQRFHLALVCLLMIVVCLGIVLVLNYFLGVTHE